MTFDDKYHKRMDEPEKICPANLSPSLVKRLSQIARATFRACHVLDYGRVDIRISPAGEPYVLEINSMASLGTGGSYVYSALATGRNFESLVQEIVRVTAVRYGLETERPSLVPMPHQIATLNLLKPQLARTAAT